IAHQIKDYWEDTGTMIRKLRMNGYELFLKDHPLSTVRLQDVITEEVKIIPGKLHIEELFLGYKDEIKAICGYGSTALLTASWLGIHAVDLSALYHFPELLKERFRIFVSMGENIRTVYSVDQLDNIGQLTDREISLPVSELYQEWENIMMGQTTNLAR
ncbi:MAG: polysialyltransferase family glycosyltransferase, partial [Pedobacter sp.]|nr:polysialyltransferase family glycosyltransferase [Pedobacter sp.]